MASEPLEPIPLSALQHWAYCPRQCALIHVEQGFEENLFTPVSYTHLDVYKRQSTQSTQGESK